MTILEFDDSGCATASGSCGLVGPWHPGQEPGRLSLRSSPQVAPLQITDGTKKQRPVVTRFYNRS